MKKVMSIFAFCDKYFDRWFPIAAITVLVYTAVVMIIVLAVSWK